MKFQTSIIILLLFLGGCATTRQSPKIDIAMQYVEAKKLSDNGDYFEAERRLKELIELKEDFYPAYESLIELYAKRGELDSLHPYLDELEEQQPRNAAIPLAKGWIYNKKNDYESTKIFYIKAIEMHPEDYRPYKELVNLYLILDKETPGSLEEAIKQLTTIAESDSAGSYGYYGLGYLYRKQKQWEKALTMLELGIRKNPSLSSLYHQQGLIYYFTSRFKEALAAWTKDLELAMAKDIRDFKEEAATCSNIGVIYDNLSNFEKALEYYHMAYSIHKKIFNIPTRVADVLLNIGITNIRLSQFQKAFENFNEALNLYSKAEYKKGIAMAYGNLAGLYDQLSLYNESSKYFHQSLDLFEELGDKFFLGDAYARIGASYGKQKRYKDAVAYSEKALTILREISYKAGEATALEALGKIYYDLSEFEKSIENYEKALSIHKATGNKILEAAMLTRMGFIYKEFAKYDKAYNSFEKALELQVMIKDINGESLTKEGMADIYRIRKDYSSAYTYLEDTIEIQESLRGKLKYERLKLGFQGKNQSAYDSMINLLYEMNKQNPSENFIKESFQYAEKSKSRTLLDLLEESKVNIRKGIPSELLDREKQIEKEFASLNTALQQEIQKPASKKKVEKIEELNRKLEALNTKYEQFKNDIIRETPMYAELKYSTPASLDTVKEALMDDQLLLIEYKITGEGIFAWRITNHTAQLIKLPISEEELEEQIQAFRNSIKGWIEADIFSEHGHGLYNSLLAPVLEGINDKTNLLIIPDGILNYLPFEVLITDNPAGLSYEELPYLIKKYTMSYSPSASVAVHLQENEKVKVKGNRILAMGDPAFPETETNMSNLYIREAGDERGKLGRLIYSGVEVEQIGKLFPNADVYKQKNASEETFKTLNLSNYKYIHLATHGIINEKSPHFSGLVFAQDTDPQEDGFLQVREIFNLKINADLVVLSACRSGLGKIVKGEGFVGLTRAWMYAGTSALIVSLWNVDDRSTQILMENFYKNINKDYASALRAAKLKLINKVITIEENGKKINLSYANPVYWAGFIFTGYR